MRRPWSFVVYAAVLLLIVSAAVAAFVVASVRQSFPQTSGEITVAGLQGPVEVLRDEAGIPQVYADTAHDLFFAQGYVQAQDRFFEMDFRRHLTSGRLSELFGSDALETDMVVRTLGWRRVAERELAILDPDTRRFLQAYANGVNAYIEGKSGADLSFEYAVLAITGPDYAPEPWTPADSVAWLKAMAWDLRSNMSDEVDRVLATANLMTAEVEQLYPRYPYSRNAPIVTQGRVVGGIFRADERTQLLRPPPLLTRQTQRVRHSLDGIAEVLADLPTLLGTREGIGSNSWAVSGRRSATGEPILANDPHLAPSMPGIWYQMGLHCRELSRACPFDVSGFTFAGMPGVIIGHNQRIAWGLTTMYADVTDLYLERVDEERGTYLYDGEQLPLRTREESFEVAGLDGRVTITIRSTRHGPLLSDVVEEAGDTGRQAAQPPLTPEPGAEPYAVSLRWTALTPGRTMDAVIGINKATSWTRFREATRSFAVPSQNLVYADVAGHIGYQAPGQIPIRTGYDGRWPVPGWDSRYDWKGYIPFEALPSVLDPDSGYVVTANQPVIGPDYRYPLTSDTSYGYRSQRLINLLRSQATHDVADMAEMQLDTWNANAAALTPFLLDIDLPTNYYRQGQRVLRDWDYTQPAESGSAAYFNAVWTQVLALTFQDQLPEAAWPDGDDRWFAVVSGLLSVPDSMWWDDVGTDDVRETRDDVLLAALKRGRDDMTRLLARDTDEWAWGHLHRLSLDNLTLGQSGVGLVRGAFNRGPYEVGGGGGTVDATSWVATDGFEVTAVPAMRMVVSMADLDASRWIQVTGASGHAYSAHYTDQTQLWVDGETLAWPFSRGAVEGAMQDRLVLLPAG
ncbi:MAG: penicillin acylase family protein [Actinomycetota bacterium]|nr:penicillin acylase family protein [Actinomycetota bacterium]